MRDMTKNEMEFVLTIFKNPDRQYNANSLSKILKISSMGALKIAKKLEKEGLLLHKQLGRAKFYSLNLNNDYTKNYLAFLLKMEAAELAKLRFDPIDIALHEFDEGVIPITIKRPKTGVAQ